MKGRTEAFTKDRLEQLAKDPGNVVYEYDYDTPEARLPPKTQMTMYRAVVLAFDKACREHRTATNEALREMVLGGDGGLRQFQQFQNLYPKVFAASTFRVLTQEDHTRLDKTRKVVMLGLLQRVQGKGSEEDQKSVTLEAAMKLCVRDATPEELASSSSSHYDPAALPKKLEKLDASAMGGSTVDQW
jgi:hypothetical protein